MTLLFVTPATKRERKKERKKKGRKEGRKERNSTNEMSQNVDDGSDKLTTDKQTCKSSVQIHGTLNSTECICYYVLTLLSDRINV